MRTIRIAFIAAVLLMAGGALLWLNQSRDSSDVALPRISQFQLTRVAPSKGRVYMDAGMTRPADLSRIDWSGDFALYADPQTAFEFICCGSMFTAMPGSAISFTSKQRRLSLQSGDFSWSRISPDERVEVSVGDAPSFVLLPQRGRLRTSQTETVIWTYSGRSSLKVDGETYSIPEHTRFSLIRRLRPRTDGLLAAPETPKPLRTAISLKEPNDSVVRFSWQRVPGAAGYVFRLYPSMLRESVLMERPIPGHQLNVDLMVFQEHADFFWDVAALDQANKLEGVPTRLGQVRLEGSLLGEKSVTRPPQLVISSLTVGGNIVLIKGEAESNSQLFINSDPVKIDMDGKFIHTMTFRTIGVKTIEFRLVSPSETETVMTRQVTIFEEGI